MLQVCVVYAFINDTILHTLDFINGFLEENGKIKKTLFNSLNIVGAYQYDISSRTLLCNLFSSGNWKA